MWHKYKNGNHFVYINDKNGTKIRETIDKNATEFISDFADSVDFKITNKCFNNCPFCHEKSTSNGEEGCIDNWKFLDTLHPYTEMAIGGGDILTFSKLYELLELLKSKNIYANITVSQESQRYVGYDKDKFGNQIEVITPLIDTDSSAYNDWHYAMLMAETQYMNLRKAGLPPEIARGVLTNDCKTELVVTATEKEWQHIINLRYYGTTGKPHPQMKELMGLILPILHTETKNRVE